MVFLQVPAHLGSPGQPLNGCVCVCVRVRVRPWHLHNAQSVIP